MKGSWQEPVIFALWLKLSPAEQKPTCLHFLRWNWSLLSWWCESRRFSSFSNQILWLRHRVHMLLSCSCSGSGDTSECKCSHYFFPLNELHLSVQMCLQCKRSCVLVVNPNSHSEHFMGWRWQTWQPQERKFNFTSFFFFYSWLVEKFLGCSALTWTAQLFQTSRFG